MTKCDWYNPPDDSAITGALMVSLGLSVIVVIVAVASAFLQMRLVTMQAAALDRVCQRYAERHAPLSFTVQRRWATVCEQFCRLDTKRIRVGYRRHISLVMVVTVSDGAASPRDGGIAMAMAVPVTALVQSPGSSLTADV